jgi:hypothetical protein
MDRRGLSIYQLDSNFLRYPRFTLILQSLASLAIGYEAISKLVPDVYFGNQLKT